MKRIEGQVKDQEELAKQVLSWITCAMRPLTTSELRHALAVEVGQAELDKENLPEIEDIVSVCAGLVTVDEESGIIRLVHYTTQEYFKWTRERWFQNAETDITNVCITYLSFHAFESGFCQTDVEFEERLRLNQLYDYVAHNWGSHAREASTLCQEVVGFLEGEFKAEAASQALLAINWNSKRSEYSQEVPRQMTGVHLAAYFGLREAMIVLLENGHDLNSKNSHSQTPLSWAARNGHETVVNLLLEKGAELETKNKNGWTPLLWTASEGHEAVVKLLLEKGAELETKNNDGWTPLLWAASEGHEAVVKLLLEKGAELETENKDGRTPLLWAAFRGHETVVKLLLATGEVDADVKDSDGRTPLWWAARHGNGAVKLLLATDRVNVDSVDRYNSTPLSIAARMGHRDVVTFLLSQSLRLNVKDNFGRTPLWWAKRTGYRYIANLLLEKYKENGILIQEVGLPTTIISVPSDKSSRYCDICVLDISKEDACYRCRVCNSGDFDICEECFMMKAYCLDQSHILIKE
jgi:ankyrin repeat protein